MPISITVFKKLYATRTEDAFPMIAATLTEEILDQEMEVQELALLLLPSHFTCLTANGPFNGPGSEELSPSETTILA